MDPQTVVVENIFADSAAGPSYGSSYLDSARKRIFDKGLAVVFIAGLLPSATVCISKNIFHGKSAFYHQHRYGGNVGNLQIPKIQSMDPQDPSATNGTVPETTYPWMVSARRRGIDEYPQLFLVLRGKLALIGPRILHQTEWEDLRTDPKVTSAYEGYKSLTAQSLTGILSPFAIAKRVYSGIDSVENQVRVNLDMRYMQNASLRNDVRLLILLARSFAGLRVDSVDEVYGLFSKTIKQRKPFARKVGFSGNGVAAKVRMAPAQLLSRLSDAGRT